MIDELGGFMEGGTNKKDKVSLQEWDLKGYVNGIALGEIRVCRPGKSRIYIKHQLAAGSASHT